MTYLFNDARNFREELLEGYVSAYSRIIQRVPDASGVMIHGGAPSGKVAVINGGGSGHFPTFCGFVGEGFVTASVVGDVFTSPSAEQVARVTRAAHSDSGVLFCVANYSGDTMNFGLAEMEVQMEDIDTATVIITDDVSSAPPDSREERRGISGCFFVLKIAGASANRGDALATVAELASCANDNTRSFGIAFGGCTVPGKTEPLFTVDEGKMELGLGIHGEPGIKTSEFLPASEIAQLLVDTVLSDAPANNGGKVAVLLNGLGSTKYEEMFVLYKDVHKALGKAGLEIHKPLVREFATSLNMAGCSLSLIWLDDELETLLDAPANSPVYTVQ
jgi:dihydroxyacetone kinase